MAKSRIQKADLLSSYKDLLKEKKGYILVQSESLDTATVTGLKKKLKALGSNYSVIKNSVFKVAIQDTDLPLEAQEFTGSTAVIAYDDDPTVPAKLVKEIQEETERMDAVYGMIEGQYLSSERVMELADIPSREVLLARLVGTMNGPLTGFMNAVTGNIKGFTTILQKLSEN